MDITKQNIDKLLDEGKIYVAMKNGRWWKIRRNGQSKYGKRLPTVKIPFKCGLKQYGSITETDFLPNGNLDKVYFRHEDDVPEGCKV